MYKKSECFTGTTQRLEMDVLDSNQRIKTLSQNIECEEDTRQEDTRGRPWRKPGEWQ